MWIVADGTILYDFNFTYIFYILYFFYFLYLTISVTLASTCTSIPVIIFLNHNVPHMRCRIIFYTHPDTYCFIFVVPVTFPTIKFISTITWEMFCSFIPLIILNDLRFTAFNLLETYSTKWIFYIIRASITPVHTNYEWILMKFINIQNCMTIHCWLFMDTCFIVDDLPN